MEYLFFNKLLAIILSLFMYGLYFENNNHSYHTD